MRVNVGELINVYPTETGELRPVLNGMNAVIVNYLPGEPDENGSPQYIRAISIACSDDEMLPFLREAANELLR